MVQGDDGRRSEGQEYKRGFKLFNTLAWETHWYTWITDWIMQHLENS